ncbi:L,D-transpeptidase [Oceaniovalibus sp. ACAM 378]|uniref:L,D-transpeptidase n=1 Tax=Oceaniovalibus sp. ACAM 378 TaxID=2599923 RepID=UPI0011D38BAA|nr:L,D-transpeptidase family protein [Oceaniovalibus sp. ACAM 378]TYB89866.1 L,D-transpeptidase family protein [Oceaniovalibus sp. ACAM 378]
MNRFSRRHMLAITTATLATPSILRAQGLNDNERSGENARRNASSFQTQAWQDHFDTLGKVTIVADTTSRALHYWAADGSDYRMYPTSVPLNEELTRLGYTEVVRKKEGPTWTPTSSMRERDPTLPTFMPAGEDNPLGTHALYLSWPAYLIHGTHDTRKIGRRSSSGCIGLYNRQIAELFQLVPVGAQVRLI